MSEAPSSLTKKTCSFRKPDGSFCKRVVSAIDGRCWQHASGLRVKLRSAYRSQPLLFWIAAGSFCFGVAGVVLAAIPLFGEQPSPAMQCEMSFMPIGVPPHGEATILLLKKAIEFTTFSNANDGFFNWPSKDQAVLANDDPKTIAKCVVRTLSGSAEDVTIPLKINLGDHPETNQSISFPVLTTTSFVFYVVNQCPLTGSLIVPDTAIVKGRLWGTREVPLHGADASSIGKIILPIMFPSHAQWANQPDCS